MSAIEIPNAFVAAGLFFPTTPQATQPGGGILSAQGFQAFDPATTPSVPKGGFTVIKNGVYALKLEEGIDAAEGVVLCSPFLTSGDDNVYTTRQTIWPAGVTGVMPLPFAGADDGRSISCQIGRTEAPGGGGFCQFMAEDPLTFTLAVFRFATGKRAADLIPSP